MILLCEPPAAAAGVKVENSFTVFQGREAVFCTGRSGGESTQSIHRSSVFRRPGAPMSRRRWPPLSFSQVWKPPDLGHPAPAGLEAKAPNQSIGLAFFADQGHPCHDGVGRPEFFPGLETARPGAPSESRKP